MMIPAMNVRSPRPASHVCSANVVLCGGRLTSTLTGARGTVIEERQSSRARPVRRAVRRHGCRI